MDWFSLLLEPLVLIGVSLLFFVILFKKGVESRYTLKIMYVILLFYGLVATPLGANFLVSMVEVSSLSKECLSKNIKTVVILGGGVTGDPDSINEIWRLKEASYRRSLEGLNLAKELSESVIIVSGGYGQRFREADLMENLIKNLGFDKEIIKDRDSFNTYASAVNVTKILTGLRVKQYWLVTSALHMKRAKNAFLKQGMEPCLYPVNRKYLYTEFPGSLLPQISALDKSTAAFHEIIGYMWYVLTGKI